MDTVNDRVEAMKRRDRKRMTLTELKELSTLLGRAVKSLDEAVRYESTSAKHPVALSHEEAAEARLDAALLYLADIRRRADQGGGR